MSALVWVIFIIFRIPGPLWAESNQRTPVVSPIKDTSYTELWCLLIVSLNKPSSCRNAGDEKPWRLYPISIQKWIKLERAPEHNYLSCWLCPNNFNHWRNMKSVIAVQRYCKFKSCLFAVMFPTCGYELTKTSYVIFNINISPIKTWQMVIDSASAAFISNVKAYHICLIKRNQLESIWPRPT